MKFRRILSCAMGIVTLLCAWSVSVSAGNTYITSAEDFQKALRKGTSTIYVGDITFSVETDITLNYDVKIIGKSSKSKITNGYFTVVGSNVPGESVGVSFENVVFDGKISKSSYDFFEQGKMFCTVFSNDRTNKRCITASWGYFSLALTNCEIKRYASYNGPAIYVDNDANFREGKKYVDLTSCSFHDNICYEATVVMFNDNGIFNIKNCTFTKNTAKEAPGFSVCNGTVNVINTFVTGNYYYHFIDSNEDGTEKYADEKLHLRNREYNYVHANGAMYIGGANALIKDCKITDNHTYYGGGVGACSPSAIVGGEKVEFVNCTIANNMAEDAGGAIYVKSNTGHTIRFVNCNIYGNKAQRGGILYATNLVPYNNSSRGGVVEFVFCTMAENTDTDGGSFGFYELVMPRVAGSIELNGCLVLDNAVYGDTTYNYVATKEKAIEDGVVSQKDIDSIETKGLTPKAGSVGDISVPADEYTAWAEMFRGETAQRKIGAPVIVAEETTHAPTTQKPTTEKETATKAVPKTTVKTTVITSEKTNGVPTTKKVIHTVPKEKVIEKTVTRENGTTEVVTEVVTEYVTEVEYVEETSAEVTGESVTADEKENEKSQISLWMIAIPLFAVIAVVLFVFLTKKKKTKEMISDETTVITSVAESIAETVAEDVHTDFDFALFTESELMEKVAAAFAESKLTNKEVEITALILQGIRRKDIAEKLVISEDTVKTHTSHIFKKLGITSRAELLEISEEKLKITSNS